jgi:type IX secretion system PorP/SprF family membrane protein
MRKKIAIYWCLIVMFLSIAHQTIVGQQTTQYTHFIHNYFAYNPALAGSPSCLNFKLGFRSQWVGLEGNPSTGFGTVQARIKGKKTRINRNYHGVGFMVEGDNVGYFSRTTLQLAYSYHFQVMRNVTASVGIFAGFQQFRMDASKVVTINYNDPALNSSASAFFVPYITPGLFLSHDDWFAGFAIRQFYRNKWDKVVGASSRNLNHHSLMGGKRFKLNKDFNIIPSAMFKWSRFTMPSLDLNVMFEWKRNIEFGLSYRNQDAISALARIKFASFFSLAYAFDFTTSKMRLGSSNTHEVILGISACPHDNKNTFICPVFD